MSIILLTQVRNFLKYKTRQDYVQDGVKYKVYRLNWRTIRIDITNKNPSESVIEDQINGVTPNEIPLPPLM